MILRDFLANENINTGLVYFDKYFYHIDRYQRSNNIEYHIERDILVIYDRKWSKIILRNNYE